METRIVNFFLVNQKEGRFYVKIKNLKFAPNVTIEQENNKTLNNYDESHSKLHVKVGKRPCVAASIHNNIIHNIIRKPTG